MKSIIKNIIPYGLVEKYHNKRDFPSKTYKNITEPEIFNSNHEQMRVFYLQDFSSKYSYSFTAGRNSKHIFWDRSNTRLPIHFYTHAEIFNTQGSPLKKFGLLMEPEVMIPNVYEKLYNNPEIVSEFDCIFTHSEKLLNKYDNTALYLGQGVWYGTNIGGGELDNELHLKKNKDVSIVSSNKTLLDSHKLRISIANSLKSNPKVDTYGEFDGGPRISIDKALTKYRFSIVLENEISSYYFTEKILNCFASMTIPIYAGASKIGEFFNEDGIILIDKYGSIDSINKVVEICTPEYYNERIEAIIDNYNRVLKYLCPDDYIYETYKELFTISEGC